MRFAAIADVHGNLAALEAVLDDIASLGIDDIVGLGDHLSGPLEPAQTADMLIARNIPSISGDQDRRLVSLHRSGPARGATARLSPAQGKALRLACLTRADDDLQGRYLPLSRLAEK